MKPDAPDVQGSSERADDNGADDRPTDRWDADSAFGSIYDDRSIVTSLKSDAMAYHHENGRTYHAYRQGTYHLPNDKDELNRLDLQHHLWRLTLDGALYLAPISQPKFVLDAGTGTGIWAIEFADEHPSATVLGTDLSPVQPSCVPPNCSFEVDDVESDWTFTQPFDFIHVRFLNAGIKDWQKLFRQAYQHLSPGGWLEVQEFVVGYPLESNTVLQNPATSSWGAAIAGAAAKIGINTAAAASFGPLLETAGFHNLRVSKPIWPVGPWPESEKEKTLGIWARQDHDDVLSGASMAFLTRIEGWTREEVELKLVDVRKEILSDDVHQYMQLYIYSAQKPAT